MTLRIALAEDNYLVREGIEQVLRGDEEIAVLASCADMPSLLEAVEADPPDVVLTDLAEVAGYANSVGRRATPPMARDAAAWLSELIVRRTASRFSRSLVPLAGVAIGAGWSMFNVRRVTRLPLRPPAPDELLRLADDIMNDEHAYNEARQRYLALPDPPDAGPPDGLPA